MASTLTSSQVAAGIQPRYEHGGVTITVKAKYTLTAALVINDVIQMVKVPLGACINEIILTADDLDTNVGPAIVLAVGDGGDDDRFIKDSTVAQAGGVVRLGSGVAVASLSAASYYQYTAEDTIDVKVTTAPATGTTAGDIVLTVIYSMNP